MATPKDMWADMNKDHKYFIASIIAAVLVWWAFYGHKYSTKGMR